MLAYSEGTANHPLTKNCGYDVIVTGLDGSPEIFTDYSDHPFAHAGYGQREHSLEKLVTVWRSAGGVMA
ncbi:hypothetical protein VSU40_000628 [Salmonella enterica]|nr:hypothetical protein [Salmonella enterica]